MASVAAVGVFNALAFAGAGYLFKMIDKNGYEKEIKRHNLAMEELSKAKEKWYENQVEKKNKIQEMRQELSDANADTNATNKALENLQKITYKGKTFTREPQTYDYYEPSDEMKEYLHLAVGTAGLVGGWGIHKMLF